MVTNKRASAASPQAAPAIPQVSNARATVVLMLGVLALSFSGIMVKEANFEPATNAILRVGLGLLFLAPFFLWEWKKKGLLDSYGIKMSLIAGCFLGIDFTCWNYSIFYAGAGIASILLNLQVIIVPMLAWVFDKYHVPKSFIILVPIFIIGIILTGGVLEPAKTVELTAENIGFQPATVYGIKTAVLGTATGCTSGVCYSFYLYFSRKGGHFRKDLFAQPIFFTGVTQLIAPTLFLIFVHPAPHNGWNLSHGVMVRDIDGTLRIPKNGWNGEVPPLGDEITAYNWAMIIGLAAFGQAMAWSFVQYGSVVLDPTVSAGLLLLSPVTTVLITPYIQGEQNSILQYVGVVVVLACVAYQNGLIAALTNKISGKKKPVEDVEEEALEAAELNADK